MDYFELQLEDSGIISTPSLIVLGLLVRCLYFMLREIPTQQAMDLLCCTTTSSLTVLR